MMGERIRHFDWSRTPLGPRSRWPDALSTLLAMSLYSPVPMHLAWGDELTTLYNDAYARFVGADRLGLPLSQFWGQGWTRAQPLVSRALAKFGGELANARIAPDGRRCRRGAAWTYSYSPLLEEGGQVAGVLCVARETSCATGARLIRPELEFLERLFDQAPGFMAYLSGPDHVHQLVNRSHRALSGGRNVQGKTAREAFPELAEQGIFELLDVTYQSGRSHLALDMQVELADAEGRLRERHVDFVFQPVLGEDGMVAGIFVEGHDVTDRAKSEALVREKEAWLSLAIAAGSMAVFEIDLVRGLIAASPELNGLFGLPGDAQPSISDLEALIEPGELDSLRTWLNGPQARRPDLFQAEFRVLRRDGERRWLLIRGRMTDDPKGRRFLGVVMDVTERRDKEERLILLMREVDHRANNLLATAQSIVSLTRADDVTSFRERTVGRLTALARSHHLLAQSAWSGADLRSLVLGELQAFHAVGRVEIDGPDVRMPPTAAQALAIALHELATNAVRHGALATPEGRVRVRWSAPGPDRFVQIAWDEHATQEVRAPVRRGLGLNLLARALVDGAGGGIELDWRPDGLRCRLRAPVI
jgi:PAS domain S-box-containing protein